VEAPIFTAAAIETISRVRPAAIFSYDKTHNAAKKNHLTKRIMKNNKDIYDIALSPDAVRDYRAKRLAALW
jgi:hypothetical protein